MVRIYFGISIFSNKKCIIFYNLGSPSIPEKNQVSMTVLTDVRCNERYYPNYNMNTQVCAGENDVSTGACQGDSGGPLVIQNPKDAKWYLIGIISWGFSCGMGTVFTRGSYFIIY